MGAISLIPLDKARITFAQKIVTDNHYLHRPVDARCSVEGYSVHLSFLEPDVTGLFLLGRPEATRVNGWYGSVEDARAGVCLCTRWQVLNLARVWFHPSVQPNGLYCDPSIVPGFYDRRGIYRSTLASDAIRLLALQVGFDYLIRRPPCFLDEPYQIEWLLSYCDTRLHRGVIYKAAGFELYRTNNEGIQTWRLPLSPLTEEQDLLVRSASALSARSQAYRSKRMQMQFDLSAT